MANDSSVYYSGHYWNDFHEVLHEINQRITGKSQTKWYEYFYEFAGRRTFKKALILNCGNGWVEREIFSACPLFQEAVGMDCSDTLLDEARLKSKDLPFRYYNVDTNEGKFPEVDFDLVINHAACHHVAYINQLFRELCRALPEDGYFVNYDYVGPHRNQYPYEHWNACWNLNNELPQSLRKEMRYPHLPTMLVTDPTEAIHSELILEMTGRYFDFVDRKRMGGALAYEILTFNEGMWKTPEADRKQWIEHILKKDLDFLRTYEASYFDYFACKANKNSLENSAQLQEFQDQENAREQNAAKNGGKYYDQTLIQSIYQQYFDKCDTVAHKEAYIGDAHKLIDELRATIELNRQELSKTTMQRLFRSLGFN